MSVRRTEPLFSLADQLFNEVTVAQLATGVKQAHRKFDAKGFESEARARFPDLELKERISALVDGLEARLPQDFNRSLDILHRALPDPLDPSRKDDDFGEFIWGVPAEFVARHGVQPDRLEAALEFLREATKRFSSENAIRPFLANFPDETMRFVQSCANDDNYHVRRLASEGIRPLLPWARKVVMPTNAILDVLHQLHADNARYVTRSVANNLNDLSKADPQLVLEALADWHGLKRQEEEELSWMTRHALRTLLNQGHADALEFLGYPSKPAFSLSGVSVPEIVQVGDSLTWQGKLTSRANQNLKIGLCVYFRRADGSHSEKLFAVADARLDKGEKLLIEKSIAFKPLSTRTLYPGTQHIELVVNGARRGKQSFELRNN